MQYRLRTLLILLAIGPPILAGGWWTRQNILERQRQAEFDALADLIRFTIEPSPWDTIGGLGTTSGFEESFSLTSVTEPEPESP